MAETPWQHEKSGEELLDALKRTLGNLRRACASYDAGHIEEAETLSTQISTLCHSGKGKIKSLLSLNGLSNVKVFDSVNRDILLGLRHGKLLAGPAAFLCYSHANGSGFSYVPSLDGGPFYLTSLADWWCGTVYLMGDFELSRQSLVAGMRDQDGGAHVDARLTNEAYHHQKVYAEGWVFEDGSPLGGCHFPSIRQIAWELDMSMRLIGL